MGTLPGTEDGQGRERSSEAKGTWDRASRGETRIACSPTVEFETRNMKLETEFMSGGADTGYFFNPSVVGSIPTAIILRSSVAEQRNVPVSTYSPARH